MSAVFRKRRDKRAFTLMELMIVIVIIGILMASVFKLFSAVSSSNRIADTKSRMERLRNAISGFYSSYGTYPPVSRQYAPPDPFNTYSDREGSAGGALPFGAGSANQASRCQPVSFEYPYPQIYDKFINEKFAGDGVLTANEVYSNADGYNKDEWSDIKMFKFGLMSFLLPRVELIGIPSSGDTFKDFNDEQPISEFYQSRQWKIHNKSSSVEALRAQRAQELREVAKWIPNLEGLVSGNAPTILNTIITGGGHINDSVSDSSFRGIYAKDGQKTVLFCTTVIDGWGNDFYYYSAPPYQSYRIWSAGADGNTFPPWIPMGSLSSSEQKQVSEWIEDDVVGFDR